MGLIKKIVLTTSIGLGLFIGCTKAPITGRSQFIMINPQQEMELGYASAKEILSKEKVSTDAQKNAMVKRVGQRIANVTEKNYKPNFKWEFFVIENDKQANAFCLPGGKVFVYTGLFKYIANDDELAIVMGHEIGHALARHGAERMSRGQLTQMGGEILNKILSDKISPQQTEYAMLAFGVGSQLGFMLPHSRQQELEADHIGIVLASQAGYNAKSALTFWKKFSQSGESPPEYLSTHPAPQNRIVEIEKILRSRGL